MSLEVESYNTLITYYSKQKHHPSLALFGVSVAREEAACAVRLARSIRISTAYSHQQRTNETAAFGFSTMAVFGWAVTQLIVTTLSLGYLKHTGVVRYEPCTQITVCTKEYKMCHCAAS